MQPYTKRRNKNMKKIDTFKADIIAFCSLFVVVVGAIALF